MLILYYYLALTNQWHKGKFTKRMKRKPESSSVIVYKFREKSAKLKWVMDKSALAGEKKKEVVKTLPVFKLLIS